MLVVRGADVHAEDDFGNSLLSVAAKNGSVEAVRFALDRGLKVGIEGVPEALYITTNPRIKQLLRDAYEKELPRCGSCEDKAAHVKFFPCGHLYSCARCCRVWDKCSCGTEIAEKWDTFATPEEGKRPKEDLLQENKRLKMENEELKGDKVCIICLYRPKKVIFTPCGHTACEACGASLRLCHTCRNRIEDRVKIY